MNLAAFSIVDYQFYKVKLDNDNFEGGDLQVAFNVIGLYNESLGEYNLQFNVDVFSNNDVSHSFLSINCKGTFKFEIATKFEDLPDFFYSNAIAILFPYVRAYASLITTQANVQGLILPTLNLAHLGDELKNQTTKF